MARMKRTQGTIATEARENGIKKSVERRTGPNPRTYHPSTSEVIYTSDEVEFMTAMNHFKNQTGRTFPTITDYLKVLRGLGYSKTCL